MSFSYNRSCVSTVPRTTDNTTIELFDAVEEPQPELTPAEASVFSKYVPLRLRYAQSVVPKLSASRLLLFASVCFDRGRYWQKQFGLK